MTNFIKIVNPLTQCALSPFTISSNLRHLGPKEFFILTHSKTVSAATPILVTEVGDKCDMLVTSDRCHRSFLSLISRVVIFESWNKHKMLIKIHFHNNQIYRTSFLLKFEWKVTLLTALELFRKLNECKILVVIYNGKLEEAMM